MARYFFNLTNATIRDADGEECADLDASKPIAIQIAHDLARNKRQPEIVGLFVCVTNERGEEVFRTPLTE
jgi:hypothetical protein